MGRFCGSTTQQDRRRSERLAPRRGLEQPHFAIAATAGFALGWNKTNHASVGNTGVPNAVVTAVLRRRSSRGCTLPRCAGFLVMALAINRPRGGSYAAHDSHFLGLRFKCPKVAQPQSRVFRIGCC
jgi:hypothetical protein